MQLVKTEHPDPEEHRHAAVSTSGKAPLDALDPDATIQLYIGGTTPPVLSVCAARTANQMAQSCCSSATFGEPVPR